jgi:signal transduction histidine kinase
MSVGDEAAPRLVGVARAPAGTGLSASAAHEINNPLDSLLNLLHLIESENLSDKGRHYLLLAQEEVRRISLIARETLNQNRVDTVPHRADVSGLLADVLDFYKGRFDSSGIAVEARWSGDGNIPVFAGLLRQVFANLLLNAAEAMPGGGKIQVRVSPGHEWSGEQRRGVRVSIGDNGSGIAGRVLPTLFQQPFTTKSGGHGMGLSLVSDVVRRHNGWLHVRSST